jgi:hypothetical protein
MDFLVKTAIGKIVQDQVSNLWVLDGTLDVNLNVHRLLILIKMRMSKRRWNPSRKL